MWKNVLFRGTYDNIESVHRAYASFLGGPIPNTFDVHHQNPSDAQKANPTRESRTQGR